MRAQYKNDLEKKGYFKFTIDLLPEEISRVLKHCQRLSYVPIFKTVGGDKDPKRSQATLRRTAATNRVFCALEYCIKTMDDNWSIAAAAVLRSEPCGGYQAVHCDMNVDDVQAFKDETGSYPVSIIISLMEGTALRLYQGCFGYADKKRERDETLEVGECLLFRGDVAHCGVDYPMPNVRLHFFITCNNKALPTEATFSVPMVNYDCRYCGKAFELLKAQLKHEGWCTKNPDTNKIGRVRVAYKRTNEVPTHCPVCGKLYDKRNSMRKHKRRVHGPL